MDGFVYLILLCAGIAFWLNSRRAHEFSLGICRHFCDKHDAMLLDQTVCLHRLRLRRGDSGRIQLERCYQFEYSYNAVDRYSGDMTILGLKPVEISFDGQRTLL